MIKLSKLDLLQREALFRTLRISITHHSNAMEGTSLNFGETKALLEHSITAHNKRIDEQLIILGFAEAYDVVIREANDKSKLLDSSFIKDLHYLIFNKANEATPEFVKKPIGAYRIDNARISGIDISLSNPSKISQDLENLLLRLKSNNLNLEQIAEFHSEYEKIHPFGDGNGRSGRLIMSFQCIQNDLVPPLIENERRDEYLKNLYNAQKNNDFKTFSKFLSFCQERSLELLKSSNIQYFRENQNKTFEKQDNTSISQTRKQR